MLSRIFEAHEANARFVDLVQTRRRKVMSELPRAIAALPDGSQAKGIIQALQSALADAANGARIGFAFDQLMPLAERHLNTGFEEALVRLTDTNGGEIRTGDLLEAVDQVPALASIFYHYLPAAQIAAFRTAGHPGALSFNIGARNIADDQGRAALEQCVALATAAGHGPLVIEATEQMPWDAPSIAFLAGLAKHYDVRIALDDVGGEKGFNDVATVASFANVVPSGHFIVKIDGKRLEQFLAGKDDEVGALVRGVHAAAPAAPIVAEWIATPEAASTCLHEMERHGLSNAFAFAQSRHIHGTPATFLAEMNARPIAVIS